MKWIAYLIHHPAEPMPTIHSAPVRILPAGDDSRLSPFLDRALTRAGFEVKTRVRRDEVLAAGADEFLNRPCGLADLTLAARIPVVPCACAAGPPGKGDGLRYTGILPRWNPCMRILVVEDEDRLAGHVNRALRRAGHRVEVCADGPSGLREALNGEYDLLVLDVNLPGLDGFAILRALRDAHNQTSVLMLTARGEVGDRVAGLKAGADDYLTKPFAMEELLARVEALGRRTPVAAEPTRLAAGDVRMDVLKRRVTRNGDTVTLSPREFELLQILMQEPGRVFSRDEICERIWEREHEYDTRTVEIFVMRLRKKLDDGRATPLIETVRGVGYTLRSPA
jgi:DNA-binding response OmpR family regulator